MHLDFNQAVALAGFAAPALNVEGKAARLIATGLGLGQFGEPIADRGKGAGVGGRVGARGAADGALVDVDDFVDVGEALDLFVGAGKIPRAMQGFGKGLIQSLQHQR